MGLMFLRVDTSMQLRLIPITHTHTHTRSHLRLPLNTHAHTRDHTHNFLKAMQIRCSVPNISRAQQRETHTDNLSREAETAGE